VYISACVCVCVCVGVCVFFVCVCVRGHVCIPTRTLNSVAGLLLLCLSAAGWGLLCVVGVRQHGRVEVGMVVLVVAEAEASPEAYLVDVLEAGLAALRPHCPPGPLALCCCYTTRGQGGLMTFTL